MPEDQVAKRGSTGCSWSGYRSTNSSLKLTVSWLKDDEPLLHQQQVSAPASCLLLSGALPSPLLLVMRGRTCSSHVGVSQNRLEEGSGPPGETPQCLPSLHSALLLSPSFPPFPPLSICTLSLSFGPSCLSLVSRLTRPRSPCSPASSSASPQRAGRLSSTWTLWLVGLPCCALGPRLSSPLSLGFGSDWS